MDSPDLMPTQGIHVAYFMLSSHKSEKFHDNKNKSTLQKETILKGNL